MAARQVENAGRSELPRGVNVVPQESRLALCNADRDAYDASPRSFVPHMESSAQVKVVWRSLASSYVSKSDNLAVRVGYVYFRPVLWES